MWRRGSEGVRKINSEEFVEEIRNKISGNKLIIKVI